uniref:BRO-N domain-containing protein n=1 Tax=Sphingorhabdus lacus TaxID=392610 RepID=UPI0035938A02
MLGNKGSIIRHSNSLMSYRLIKISLQEILNHKITPLGILFMSTRPNEGQRGGARLMTIINESGLYSLILRSRKPEAKLFKKWVTKEVLPSIRKTGGFGVTTPAFIRRYNQNWDRVSQGHFSVINELVIRLWGRFEHLGHIMADKAACGTENRPDVSVGIHFSRWLKKHHPAVADNYSMYVHWTEAKEVEARQYPMSMIALFHEFLDTEWITKQAERYFNTRDPAALPHVARLLPSRSRPAPLARRV